MNATLSEAAYQGFTPEGFVKDSKLSSIDRAVFFNPENKKAVIAYRGTELGKSSTRWRDIGADLAIAFGAQGANNRFKNAERVARAAINKYGYENVLLTGHSLGGSQAMYVSKKTGLPAEVYNPGVGLGDLVKQHYENVKAHIVPGDPVSFLGLGVQNYKKKTVNWKPTKNVVSGLVKGKIKSVASKAAAASVAGPEAAAAVGLYGTVEGYKAIPKVITSLHSLQNFTNGQTSAIRSNASTRRPRRSRSNSTASAIR